MIIPETHSYITELKQTIDHVDMIPVHKLIAVLHGARMRGQKVFIMGNGGSASTASHLACDLIKNTRKGSFPLLQAISLTDNTAVLLAYANDKGYKYIFSQQLVSLISSDDIVIGISTSGNSPNVLEAIRLANLTNVTTVGFTGFDAGMLGSMVDLHIHVPSDCIEHVEDIHLIIGHLVTKALRDMEWT